MDILAFIQHNFSLIISFYGVVPYSSLLVAFGFSDCGDLHNTSSIPNRTDGWPFAVYVWWTWPERASSNLPFGAVWRFSTGSSNRKHYAFCI